MKYRICYIKYRFKLAHYINYGRYIMATNCSESNNVDKAQGVFLIHMLVKVYVYIISTRIYIISTRT